MARPEKIRLGDLLVHQELISQDQLDFGLDQQKLNGGKLGRVLVENAFVTEENISKALAKQLGIPYVNLKRYHLNLEHVRLLPENQARRFRAIVLEDRDSNLLIGMADPTDLFAFGEIGRIVKRNIDLAVVTEGQLLETIDRGYRRSEEIPGLVRERRADAGDASADYGQSSNAVRSDDASAVKLLQSMFHDATQKQASNIHIEHQDGQVTIRFRIDGVLHKQSSVESKIASALVLRLKLMAGLDTSEKHLPQDGGFHVPLREQRVDVCLSTCPTRNGELVVMQLLHQDGGMIGLDKLDMPPEMLERLREIIQCKNGMILVVGPTDSGRTTTIYSALSEIDSMDQKVITVEDPVKYRLSGVNQIQVNENINLTFSRILRSVMRQDPDVILVGEICEAKTAQISLCAAMTGHLVFSTLHARDAASTLFYLVDMGVSRRMVSSSVRAIISQRLLRTVCNCCSKSHVPTAQEAEWLLKVGVTPDQYGGLLIGRGCSNCNGTGYRGRTGVFEMLEMSSEMVEVATHESAKHFMQVANRCLHGKTILSYALEKMKQGRTTISEVERISNQLAK